MKLQKLIRYIGPDSRNFTRWGIYPAYTATKFAVTLRGKDGRIYSVKREVVIDYITPSNVASLDEYKNRKGIAK